MSFYSDSTFLPSSSSREYRSRGDGCLHPHDFYQPASDYGYHRIGDTIGEASIWTTSRRKKQWIWPKDKHQSSFGRFKDVLTGKGPDIFVQRQGDAGLHRSVWSGWNRHGLDSNWDRHGQFKTSPHSVLPRHGESCNAMPLFDSASRRHREGQVYDFRKRKYGRAGPRVWSDVRWSRDKPRELVYMRDRDGFDFDFRRDGYRMGSVHGGGFDDDVDNWNGPAWTHNVVDGDGYHGWEDDEFRDPEEESYDDHDQGFW